MFDSIHYVSFEPVRANQFRHREFQLKQIAPLIFDLTPGPKPSRAKQSINSDSDSNVRPPCQNDLLHLPQLV